jgi:hypothetical protein
VAALLCCAVILLSVGGVRAWQAHDRSVELASRQHAEESLSAMSLPWPVARQIVSGCQASADTRCAASSLTPHQIEPALAQLLRGQPNANVCAVLSSPFGTPCPVYGTIDGYPAMGMAFPRLVIIDKGAPPAGAVPVKTGNLHAFFVGSDVTISLLTPST